MDHILNSETLENSWKSIPSSRDRLVRGPWLLQSSLLNPWALRDKWFRTRNLETPLPVWEEGKLGKEKG